MSQFLFSHTVQTHNNSLANLCRGVGERVLYTNSKLDRPIKPAINVFEQRLHHYRDRLSQIVGVSSPVTYNQFVDYYKGPRRSTYQRAVDSLAITPVGPRDAILKTFVKAEKHILDYKADPVPRVIQPRDPRFNVEVGRYLRPLEPKLYNAIDELFESPTIMSHYNAYKQAEIIVGKFNSFRRPVCVGLDASRFDQHVSAQALRFEHSFYHRVYHSRLLDRLLQMQIYNHGRARASDGHFEYDKKGSRMSGDMNTSMGNKFLMCLMAKAYIDSKSFRIEFVNNGDDCLIFLERKNLKSIGDMSQYFRDFGFNIVTEEPVYEIEHIEFCQSKPMCANGIWRMVRNIRSCMTKDVTSVNLGHDVLMYRRLLRDIGDCGLAFAADVPVLGQFYRMLRRFGVEGNYQGKWREYNYYHTAAKHAYCKHKYPDAQSRYSFWKMTGISPDEQKQMEAYFKKSIWGGDKRQTIDQYFKWLLPTK